jgi:hypothetical protein
MLVLPKLKGDVIITMDADLQDSPEENRTLRHDYESRLLIWFPVEEKNDTVVAKTCLQIIQLGKKNWSRTERFNWIKSIQKYCC